MLYLDEPSTGLDPASRRLLWKVGKRGGHDVGAVSRVRHVSPRCPTDYSVPYTQCILSRRTLQHLKLVTSWVIRPCHARRPCWTPSGAAASTWGLLNHAFRLAALPPKFCFRTYMDVPPYPTIPPVDFHAPPFIRSHPL